MPNVNALRGAVRLAAKRDLVAEVFAGWQHCLGAMNVRLEALAARYRLDTRDWLPLGPLRMVRDGLAGLLDRVLDRAANANPPVVKRAVEPLPLNEERAWPLATGVIHVAAELAQSAGKLHEAAALQIDAAVYALDDLMKDLRPVMNVGKSNVGFFARQAGEGQEAATRPLAIAVKAEVEQPGQKIQNAA